MNILKHILTALYKSVYDIKWIAAQRTSLWKALIYFFVFLFVLIGVRGYFFAKQVPSLITEYWQVFNLELPDFTVEKKDGLVSFEGLSQPFVTEIEEKDVHIVVYIDTVSTSSISVEDVLGESTDTHAVIITSKKLKLFDADTNQINIEDITELPDFSYTKAEIEEEVLGLRDSIFPWMYIGGTVLATVVIGIGKLIYILFLSWLIYAMARIDKKTVKFFEIFVIGIYAITLAVIVQWGVTFFVGGIPYVYSILALSMMYLVVFKSGIELHMKQPIDSDKKEK